MLGKQNLKNFSIKKEGTHSFDLNSKYYKRITWEKRWRQITRLIEEKIFFLIPKNTREKAVGNKHPHLQLVCINLPSAISSKDAANHFIS